MKILIMMNLKRMLKKIDLAFHFENIFKTGGVINMELIENVTPGFAFLRSIINKNSQTDRELWDYFWEFVLKNAPNLVSVTFICSTNQLLSLLQILAPSETLLVATSFISSTKERNI